MNASPIGATVEAEPVFEEFKWSDALDASKSIGVVAVASQVDVTRDLARGVCTVLALLEREAINRDTGDQPLMSAFHLGALTRMAHRAAWIIANEADEMADRLTATSVGRTH